jgi:GT2 family glycosyltransferase
MVDISVVIVNYNVKYFLELCLVSVERASKQLNVEILVVDNNSQDGSKEYITARFPNINYIYNNENLGFSKANNQAIALSKGPYTLILNPDTIIAEDTLQKCMAFMASNQDAGGIGVPMYDGKGMFLRESKRSLPTPRVAFYKISGFASLFPHSRKFAQYHLGHLSQFETHEVDILSGAFMFMRKAVLDQIGYFDESFFMYGEDIDLSYRVQLAGYKNYYLSETSIIHFKGESTKKGSLNYVIVFYKAMEIFANKHLTQNKAIAYHLVIRTAIWLRAFLSIIKRLIQTCISPLKFLKLKLYRSRTPIKRIIFGLPEEIEDFESTITNNSHSAYYTSINLNLSDFIKTCQENRYNEVVLLSDSLSCGQIISIAQQLHKFNVNIKIIAPQKK